MTDAEKDAAWRLLPDGFKKEVSRHYKSWHNSLAFGGECAVLEYIFGKHNLTATEEEKPRLSKGDKVIYVGCNKDWIGSRFVIDGNIFYNDYFKCLMASSISDGDTHIGNVPLSNLAPYTEGQELKHKLTNGDKVVILSEPFVGIYGEVTDFIFDNGKLFIQVVTKIGEKLIEPQNLEIIPSTTQNCEKSVENDIPSMSKEDAEELAKCLAAVDDFIKESKDSQVDWLSYRMGLAKEVVKVVYHHNTPHKDIIDDTISIVDGIVERLKGGKNEISYS